MRHSNLSDCLASIDSTNGQKPFKLYRALKSLQMWHKFRSGSDNFRRWETEILKEDVDVDVDADVKLVSTAFATLGAAYNGFVCGCTSEGG